MANIKFPVIPLFFCHSRERGNPESRIKIPKVQIPHQVRNDKKGSVIPAHAQNPDIRIQSAIVRIPHRVRNDKRDEITSLLFSFVIPVKTQNPDFRFRVKHGMTVL